jgi:hypothetical protein
MPGARKDLKARFDAETPKSRLRRIGSAIGRGMGMTPSMSSASGASLRHSETGVGNFGNALPLAYRPQTRWSQSNGSTRSWPRRDEDEAICPRRRRRTLPSNTSEEAEGPISWLVVDNDFAGFTQPDFDPESERQREAKEREQDAEIDRAMALADIESVSYSDGTSSRLRKPAGRIRRAKRFAARAWRYFYGFADSSFNNEQTEQAFQRETWSNGKTAALCSSLYLLIQYILWVGLTPSSTIRGKLTYIMGCGICSIPLPFMVLFDGQRRFKWIYQVWVASCAWIWGVSIWSTS